MAIAINEKLLKNRRNENYIRDRNYRGNLADYCYKIKVQFSDVAIDSTDMDSRTENIPIQLDNGVDVLIETTMLGGEEEVDFDFLPFNQVTRAVEAIADSMAQTIEKVKPSKASIELGLEIGLQEGKLVTLIVQNSAKANFKITLEWEK